MFFNFNDPEQARQLLEQLKISFENAANVPNPAQPQFKKLSRQFNIAAQSVQTLMSDPKSMDPMMLMMQLGPSMMALKTTSQQIQEMAQSNSEVRAVWNDLGRDISERMKPYLKDMPQFPGLPDFRPDQDDQDQGGQNNNGGSDQPKPPKKPSPKDFNI